MDAEAHKASLLEEGKSGLGVATSTVRPSASSSLTLEEIPENLAESILTLVLCMFAPLYSIGMSYWYCSEHLQTLSLLALAPFILTVTLSHIAFWLASSSLRASIFGKSKLVWAFCMVPGAPSVLLSMCNVLFTLQETASPSYRRAWSGTRHFFLLESLALAFPQALLGLVVLGEREKVDGYRNYAILFAVITFSIYLTLARFRYAARYKGDRYGASFDKYFRFLCLWANKALWLTTFALSVLSFRLYFSKACVPTVVSIAVPFVIHEVPAVILTFFGGKKLSSAVGGLMLIPQFTLLTILLWWVNLDPAVYDKDAGVFLLGVIFWGELLVLSGWLYDRCVGWETDFLGMYSHFFLDTLWSLKQY